MSKFKKKKGVSPKLKIGVVKNREKRRGKAGKENWTCIRGERKKAKTTRNLIRNKQKGKKQTLTSLPTWGKLSSRARGIGQGEKIRFQKGGGGLNATRNAWKRRKKKLGKTRSFLGGRRATIKKGNKQPEKRGHRQKGGQQRRKKQERGIFHKRKGRRRGRIWKKNGEKKNEYVWIHDTFFRCLL